MSLPPPAKTGHTTKPSKAAKRIFLIAFIFIPIKMILTAYKNIEKINKLALQNVTYFIMSRIHEGLQHVFCCKPKLLEEKMPFLMED